MMIRPLDDSTLIITFYLRSPIWEFAERCAIVLGITTLQPVDTYVAKKYPIVDNWLYIGAYIDIFLMMTVFASYIQSFD